MGRSQRGVAILPEMPADATDGCSPASGFPQATASASTSGSPSSSLDVLEFPPMEHQLSCPSPPCLGLCFTSAKPSNISEILLQLYFNHDTASSNNSVSSITSLIWLFVHLQTISHSQAQTVLGTGTQRPGRHRPTPLACPSKPSATGALPTYLGGSCLSPHPAKLECSLSEDA